MLHDRKNITIDTVSKTGGHTIQSSTLYSAINTQIIIRPVAPDPKRRKLKSASSIFLFTLFSIVSDILSFQKP